MKASINYLLMPLVGFICGQFLFYDSKSLFGGILLLSIGFLSGYVNKDASNAK